MLIPVIALYASSLGAILGTTGLIIGLYSITNTPANMVFGRLIDRFGSRRPLVAGLTTIWFGSDSERGGSYPGNDCGSATRLA